MVDPLPQRPSCVVVGAGLHNSASKPGLTPTKQIEVKPGINTGVNHPRRPPTMQGVCEALQAEKWLFS